MLSYIKGYDLNNIKNKLGLLYFLNVMDILFTVILLKTGLFVEANPFMVPIVNNPVKLSIIKIIFPALLLAFLFFRIRKAKEHQLIISNKIINGALCGYILLNLSHLFWLNFNLIIGLH